MYSEVKRLFVRDGFFFTKFTTENTEPPLEVTAKYMLSEIELDVVQKIRPRKDCAVLS